MPRLAAMTVYADVFRYRELFGSLFQRELRAKYKGSVLGLGWSLVYPLVLMAVYLLIFSVLWRRNAIDHYALFLLVGLAVWVFFSSSVALSARSLVDSAELVRKVRFPRQLVPLSVVATQLVTFGVMLAGVVVLNLALLPRTRHTFWLALPLSALFVALVAGVALAIACANVVFRDVEHVLGAILLPWFFLTPILYTFATLPGAENHHTLVQVLRFGNFVAPPLDAIRDPLFFGRWPHAVDVIYLACGAVVALLVGAFAFSRVDDRIAVEL
jgi:homopolymeric O-antigen transport system permease protein